MKIVNRIGEAEQERVDLLAEELGESLQVLGKILRHGMDSHHPDMPLLSNRDLLELEAGHVLAALDLMVECGTLSREGLHRDRVAKLKKLRSWLHCGTNLDAVQALLEPQVAPSSESGFCFTRHQERGLFCRKSIGHEGPHHDAGFEWLDR